MKILQRFFGEKREAVKLQHPRDPVLATWFGGSDNDISVTPDSALRVSAVYACVAVISETIAALPLHVLKKDGENNSKATEHPLYRLIHDCPTPSMTTFEWLEMLVSHTALRGDSYARIVTRGDGSVESLPPIHPDHITPEWGSNGKVRYRWYENGNGPVKILLDDEVLRLPHKMLDGLKSLSPISLHRETISTSMAAKKYLDAFYKNSAQPKGALATDEVLSQEAVTALRDSWNERHMGPANGGRIAIFDGGLKWQAIGMSMEDQQFLDLQQFSVTDIARIFLMPPHKIGDLSKATFSNIEHQAIEFVTGVVLRWCRRIESRMNAYLLSQADRKAGYYIAFDLKGLLRGDAAARAAFYRAMFYIGGMNPNEIRAAEDMNPYEGGDKYYVQGATMPIDQLNEALNGLQPGMKGNKNEGN